MAKDKELTEKQQRARARRAALIELSKGLKPLLEMGEAESINEAIKMHYEQQGHTELNTYKQWKEQGRQVLRGSEALQLWGRPRQSQQGSDEESEETKFWPVCNVFSNMQLEALEETAEA